MEPNDGTAPEVVAEAPAPAAPAQTGDDALLAELEAMDGKPEPPAKGVEDATDEGEPEKPEPQKQETKAEDQDKADAEAEKADPALAKRLDVIARREKHQKAEHEKRVEELKKLQTDLETTSTALKTYETAKGKARADLPAFLESLGYKPSEFLEAAKMLFGARPDAKPEERRQAEDIIRGRHERTAIETLQEKLDRLENERKAERDQAVMRERVAEYRENLTEAAAKLPETSLLRGVDTKNAKTAKALQDRLYAAADKLSGELKRLPEPDEVLEAYESNLREELALLGIDLGKLNGTTTKTKTPEAGEKKTASPTLGNDLGTTKKPRPVPKTFDEAREMDFEETEAELRKLTAS